MYNEGNASHNSAALLASWVEVQKSARVPQGQVQPRVRSKARKRLMLTRNRRFKRNAIVSTMRQAAHALTSIAALTRARGIIAARQNHFVPKEARW